jgi:hypothetical protein
MPGNTNTATAFRTERDEDSKKTDVLDQAQRVYTILSEHNRLQQHEVTMCRQRSSPYPDSGPESTEHSKDDIEESE